MMLPSTLATLNELRACVGADVPAATVCVPAQVLINAIATIESLSFGIEQSCIDWAEDHTHIEKVYIQRFGPPDEHVSIIDMFDRICAFLPTDESYLVGHKGQTIGSFGPFLVTVPPVEDPEPLPCYDPDPSLVMGMRGVGLFITTRADPFLPDDIFGTGETWDAAWKDLQEQREHWSALAGGEPVNDWMRLFDCDRAKERP